MDERRRIGQDLHDGLGQELSTLGLFLTGLARSLDAEGSAGAALAHRLVGLAEDADAHARAIARSLVPVELERRRARRRPPSDGRAGRPRSTASRCRSRSIGGGPAGPRPSTPEAATNLYWIAQEAISNAVQHGHARHILRRPRRRGPITSGSASRTTAPPFAPPAPQAQGRPARARAWASASWRHRAHLAGGTLDVRPGAEGGTVVTCTVPLHGPGFHPSSLPEP